MISPQPLITGVFYTITFMYVYLIKSSIYYKIGYSKNPKNRLKTIKTHNPFEVVLFAQLKTDDYLILEKELHQLFSNKNSRREWFELHEEDLLHLKIEYGFNFLIPIKTIKNSSIKNEYILNEMKEIRIDNNKIDYFVSYFEELFGCIINDKKIIKRCCNKFDTEIIKKAIDNLFNQNKESNESYSLLYKVCSNIQESILSPEKYFVKVIKAICYKHYNWVIGEDNVNYLKDNYNHKLDVNEVIKEVNSKKYYLDEDEFWEYINNNYLYII